MSLYPEGHGYGKCRQLLNSCFPLHFSHSLGPGGTVGGVIGLQAVTKCIAYAIKQQATDWQSYEDFHTLILPTNTFASTHSLQRFAAYGRLIAVAFAWGITTPAISPYLILYLVSGGNRTLCTDPDFIRRINESQAEVIQEWPATLSDYKKQSTLPHNASTLRLQVDENPVCIF